jgi:hypothetical protein
MAEQSIGMTTGLGDGTAGGYTADRMRDMELRTFNQGILLNSDGTQAFALSGNTTSTLTIGIGNAVVAGWFYQNTSAATISVATGVVNGTYNINIIANNTAGTVAVTKTVAGVATIPAYTVRLALGGGSGSGAITIGTCVVTGGVLSLITYLNTYASTLAIPYQTALSMTAGTATLTTAGTVYTVAGYSTGGTTIDNIFASNNTTGIITVNRTGWFNIVGQVLFTAGTTSYRTLYITQNAATVINRVDQTSVGFANHNMQIYGMSYLTSGDTIKLQAVAGLAAQSISGASLTIALV